MQTLQVLVIIISFDRSDDNKDIIQHCHFSYGSLTSKVDFFV